MSAIDTGDRVELVTIGCQGTVEYSDDYYVRVKWDDGQIGLLYFDKNMIPRADRLQKLSAHIKTVETK